MDKKLPQFWVYGCCKVATDIKCTLKISWFIKDFSIEKYHACLNIARVCSIFSKYMEKGLSHYSINGYCKIVVNVCFFKINILLTRCVTNAFHLWLFFHTWQIDGYIQKLAPSLQFLPLFNYNQLSFTMCFFLIH